MNFSPEGDGDSDDEPDDTIGEESFSSLFGLRWRWCWLKVSGGWGRRWVELLVEQCDKSKPLVRIRRVNDGRRSDDDGFIFE